MTCGLADGTLFLRRNITNNHQKITSKTLLIQTIFKLFTLPHHNARGRKARHDLQSCISAPLEILDFLRIDSLALLIYFLMWSRDKKKFKERSELRRSDDFSRCTLIKNLRGCALWCKHLRPQHGLKKIFYQSRPQTKTLKGIEGAIKNFSTTTTQYVLPFLATRLWRINTIFCRRNNLKILSNLFIPSVHFFNQRSSTNLAKTSFNFRRSLLINIFTRGIFNKIL